MTSRPDRLLDSLPGAGVEMMLVTNLVNVGYLTGYSGTNGLAVIGPGTRTFITDFRYVEQAAEEVDPSFDRRRASLDLLDALAEVLPPGEHRVGFEDAHMSVRQHARLRELLPDRIELQGVTGAVERLRAIKEPDEIARIRAATDLADEALLHLLEQGLVGRTERDVAIALEHDMRLRGAQRPSFESIIAGGPHGALPHAQPRDVEITADQLVVIDWGAELDGYCSDCTRTVATGDLEDTELAAYELVLEAQQAGLDGIRAGRSGKDADGDARAVIERGGQGERFGHGLGHGVGIEVHEAPRLSQRSEDVLEASNVVTVEPGVYVPGRFGIRIEDLVVVTEDGCDVLTSTRKDLITVA